MATSGPPGWGDGEVPRRGDRNPHHPRQHAGKIFEQVVSGADVGAQCLAGASRLPHDAGLVYKVLGMETEPVTSKVRAFWDLVRHEVTGAPIPAARL
jgi:urease accessory protein